jgi:molecular chaperone DnaJ
MKVRDYYVVLGVDRAAPPETIRRAFHELALKYHPDRAGAMATALFSDIVEAYRVLSDARSRAAYDRALAHSRVAVGDELPVTPVPIPGAGPRDEVQPWASGWSWRASVERPRGRSMGLSRVSRLKNVWVHPPDLAAVLHRVRRSLLRQRPPVSEALEPVTVDLVLGAEQAARGGLLTLEVPVYFPCHACRGTGVEGREECPVCGGDQVLPEPRPLTVPVPPGVPDGTEFEIQLRGLGVHSLYLKVRTRVLDEAPRLS